MPLTCQPLKQGEAGEPREHREPGQRRPHAPHTRAFGSRGIVALTLALAAVLAACEGDLPSGPEASAGPAGARPELATPPLATPTLATASAAVTAATPSVVLYVHAHQDDWQLFMGDRVNASVQSGAKVVFVYVTAGDAGNSTTYWQTRERAARVSVDQITPAGTWTCGTQAVRTHPIRRCVKGNTVSYHMRLPNDNPFGTDLNNGWLQALRDDGTDLTAKDGSTTYTTWTDLWETIGGVIDVEAAGQTAPAVAVHAPDYDRARNPGDHSDHWVVADAVHAAAATRVWDVTWYVDYDTQNRASNVSSEAHAIKEDEFLAYDSVMVAGGYASLASNSKYQAWLWRTYFRSERTGPSGTPVASAGGPYTGSEGTAVQLSSAGSSDPNGQTLTYSWSFGDGTTSTSANPLKTFADNGTYPISLTVKNAAGNSSTANTTATVTNATPVVAFSATSAASGAPGVTVNFHGSFTDKGARDATWAYTVVWGDGTPNTTGTTTTPITATTPLSVSHAYSTAGTWSAYMTVKDKDGATGTSAKTTVTVSAPSAPLTASANGPYSGAEGAGIQFSSTGSGAPAGRTLSYAWRFGDGTTSTAANPLKTYADNGTYAVRLIVTDGSGAADTATTSATVSNVAPTASFTPPAAVEGTAYTLSLSGATDRGSTDRSSLQYSLDCGQGAGFTAWGTTSSASCPAVPDQRTLTVQGRVRDKDGAVTSYTKALAVANAAPVVAFSATTATSVVRGATVGFHGSFTDKGANDATWSYTIVWGDGTTNKTGTMTAQGALPAASHVYSTAGTWKATLKVTDKDGASTTSAAVTVTVTGTPPSKLTATGFREKGDEYARLAWTKGSATTVDVWRGSSKIRSAISNTGAYTDHIGKHANGTYTYKVCIAGKTGTTNCSNSASVNF